MRYDNDVIVFFSVLWKTSVVAALLALRLFISLSLSNLDLPFLLILASLFNKKSMFSMEFEFNLRPFKRTLMDAIKKILLIY